MEVAELQVGETDGDVNVCAVLSISGELECDVVVPLYIKPSERAGVQDINSTI